jgi:hypothetical protein
MKLEDLKWAAAEFARAALGRQTFPCRCEACDDVSEAEPRSSFACVEAEEMPSDGGDAYASISSGDSGREQQAST